MSENKDKNEEFENENIVETDEVSTEDSVEKTVENSDSHDESQYEKVCYVAGGSLLSAGRLQQSRFRQYRHPAHYRGDSAPADRSARR